MQVVAAVRPSEDPVRVEKALRNLFPDASIERAGDELVGTCQSLQNLRNMIWKAKILDAARRVLLGSLDESGDRASFSLSKQAAYAGHVSFSVANAPLGDIAVHVRGKELEALFKTIAPPTERARPITEEEYERKLARSRRAKEHSATFSAALEGGEE